MFQSWSNISVWAGNLLEHHRGIQVIKIILWLILIQIFETVVGGRRKMLSLLWIASIKEIVLNLMGCTVAMMGYVQSKCQQFTFRQFRQNIFRLTNWECERFCVDIPTYDDSLVSMAGDTIISSSCRRAVNIRTGEKIWDILDHPDTILLSSCTSLEITEDNIIRGKDCINGTTMPVQLFDDFTNFTTLMNLFQVV